MPFCSMIRGCALTCVGQYTSGASAEQLELMEGKAVKIIEKVPMRVGEKKNNHSK